MCFLFYGRGGPGSVIIRLERQRLFCDARGGTHIEGLDRPSADRSAPYRHSLQDHADNLHLLGTGRIDLKCARAAEREELFRPLCVDRSDPYQPHPGDRAEYYGLPPADRARSAARGAPYEAYTEQYKGDIYHRVGSKLPKCSVSADEDVDNFLQLFKHRVLPWN